MSVAQISEDFVLCNQLVRLEFEPFVIGNEIKDRPVVSSLKIRDIQPDLLQLTLQLIQLLRVAIFCSLHA